MTHDNHKKSNRSQSSITTNHEDSIINLPDLSAFQEAEKRHIINVLIRDEDLRNKHLSRFMYVDKIFLFKKTKSNSNHFSGIYEKKLQILNNNQQQHHHQYVLDVTHHSVLYLIQVMRVQNVVQKFVNNVD